MNAKAIAVIVVAILLIGFAGLWQSDAMKEKMVEVQLPSDKVVIVAGTNDPLYDFTPSIYEQALQSDKLIVLYFYANWCPICKVETQEALYPFFNESMTGKVTGIRINYNDNQTDDSERAIAREFGVAYQHTKVLIKNGQRILKSPESWDKARYQTEINNLLDQ